MAKRAKRRSGKAKPEFELIRSTLHLWIRETYPNPERKGCPGRKRLEVVVRARSKVEDEYTLDHIGQCPACLDEMKEIKRDIADAASSD